jgi:hypothetical protein
MVELFSINEAHFEMRVQLDLELAPGPQRLSSSGRAYLAAASRLVGQSVGLC